MAHAISLPLMLAGQRGQDFGWQFPRAVRGNYGFDCLDTYDNAPAVEPVLDVTAARGPFEIVRSVVESVLVFVVDHIQPKRVGDKGFRDKAVDQERLDLTVSGQFGLHVAVLRDGRLKQAASNVSLPRPVSDKSGRALYSTEVADLVAAEPNDRAPFFASQRSHFVGFGANAEYAFESGVNVELHAPAVAPKANNFVTVVEGDRHQFGAEALSDATPVSLANTRQSANSPEIGDFVKPHVVGDRNPSFTHSILHKQPKELEQYASLLADGQASTLTAKSKEM